MKALTQLNYAETSHCQKLKYTNSKYFLIGIPNTENTPYAIFNLL